jgi:hypothetical protein
MSEAELSDFDTSEALAMIQSHAEMYAQMNVPNVIDDG